MLQPRPCSLLASVQLRDGAVSGGRSPMAVSGREVTHGRGTGPSLGSRSPWPRNRAVSGGVGCPWPRSRAVSGGRGVKSPMAQELGSLWRGRSPMTQKPGSFWGWVTHGPGAGESLGVGRLVAHVDGDHGLLLRVSALRVPQLGEEMQPVLLDLEFYLV